MRAIILYTFFSIISVSMVFAGPNVTALDKTLSKGSIVTVTGSEFGAEDRSTFLTYDSFDDTDFWQGEPIAFEAWTNDGKDWQGRPNIVNLFYSGEDLESTGEKTFQVHQDAAFYSSGWGFRKNIEKESSSTGVQGGRLVFNTPTKPTEIWIRYYQRWSPNWPTIWNVTESKQMYIQIGSWTSDHDYIMPHLMKQWPNSSQAWWRIYNGSGSQGTCLEPYGNDCNFYQDDLEWTGPDKWNEIKYHIKLQSGSNDVFEWWLNGKKIMTLTDINLDGDNTNEFISGVQFGANFSGPIATTFLNTNEEYEDRDNMVIAKNDPGSVPAVFLSNSSTWNGPATGTTDWCNGTEEYIRQKVGGTANGEKGYEAWNNNSFKFQVNTSGLNTTDSIYLYVTNWNGEVNPVGFDTNSIADSGDSSDEPVVYVPSIVSNLRVLN